MQSFRTLGRIAWKRREPVFWMLLIGIVFTAQWPMLKGRYYQVTGQTASASSSIEWRSSLDAALKEARVEKGLVLVDFSASWCPPCVVMKREVWPNPEVAAAVNKSYVPVVIDADRDGGILDRYQVGGIPAVLILDSNGAVVRRHDGYLPRSGMTRFLAGE